jgi:hypothetical protein
MDTFGYFNEFSLDRKETYIDKLLIYRSTHYNTEMAEKVTKRRRSSALDQLKPNWRDERSDQRSQVAEYWQVIRGVEVTPQTILSKHQRGLHAISERWARNVFNFQPDDEDDFLLFDDDAEVDRYKGFYDDRRTAIKYLFFVVFGAPNMEQWHEMHLISAISHMLHIPQSSHTSVKQTLLEIVLKMEAYSGQRLRSSGRNAAIVHGTAQAKIIYDSLSNNLTVADTASVVNVYRTENGIATISRSAVQAFIKRSEFIKTRKRQNKKSGRENPECNWAVCRLAQSMQWQEQFRLGCLPSGAQSVTEH